MSETPRTDQHRKRMKNGPWVRHEFAEKLEQEVAALKAELAEYRASTDPHYVDELAEARADGIALRAWHSQFGTSQLSHAIAERNALKAENAMLTETLLGMRHATCVRYPERRCSECERIEQALASRGRENNQRERLEETS